MPTAEEIFSRVEREKRDPLIRSLRKALSEHDKEWATPGHDIAPGAGYHERWTIFLNKAKVALDELADGEREGGLDGLIAALGMIRTEMEQKLDHTSAFAPTDEDIDREIVRDPRGNSERPRAAIRNSIVASCEKARKQLVELIGRAEVMKASEGTLAKRRERINALEKALDTPEAFEASAELAKLYKRRDAHIGRGKRWINSDAGRDEAQELNAQIMRLEIALNEPRYAPIQ